MSLQSVQLGSRRKKRYADYQTNSTSFYLQRNTQQIITGLYTPVPGNTTWTDMATFSLASTAPSAPNKRIVSYTGTVFVALLDGDAANRATADIANFRLAYFNDAGTQVSAGAATSFSIAAGAHQFSYTFLFVLDSNVSTAIATVRVQKRDSFMTTSKAIQAQYTLVSSPSNNRV